jgi:(1->4)-alpha-D-glucan 1-alpha-D-glucosylmutase
VVAFGRGEAVVTIVPRLVLPLTAPGAERRWGLTAPAAETVVELPPGRWKDEISGRTHRGTAKLGDLLDVLPVALLSA